MRRSLPAPRLDDTVRGLGPGMSGTSTTYIQGTKMRAVSGTSDTTHSTVFDLDAHGHRPEHWRACRRSLRRRGRLHAQAAQVVLFIA